MSSLDNRKTLKDAYSVIGDLWCSLVDDEAEAARRDARGVVERLAPVDGASAEALARFLDAGPCTEEEYIDLFELQPKCALYLGSHVYSEPKTCAGAGVSDRNDYMIDLGGVYRHFGRKPNGKELPDYLPLMVDFLSMTAQSASDPVRDRFLEKYFLPFIPPMRKKLEEIGTPYLHLLDALERIASYDLETNGAEHAG